MYGTRDLEMGQWMYVSSNCKDCIHSIVGD
jgi:hypothetical protein